jgi:O-antigen ligase
LGIFLLSEQKNQRLFFGIFSLVLIVALFLTKSYGAFLGILAAFLFLVAKGIKEKKKKWFYLGIVFLVLATFVLLQISTPKFAELFNISGRTSIASRIEIWKASFLMIKENPILGTGLGTFQQVYTEYIPRVAWPPLEWAVPQPHNIFLAFWLNMGILGLFAFIWIVIEFFKLKVSYSLFLIRYSLLAAMICILVHGLVDTPYWKNDLSCLFWIIVGVMIVISNTNHSLVQNVQDVEE